MHSPPGSLAARPSLLDWLASPAPGRGIHFVQPDGSASFLPYLRLAEMTRQAATGLAQNGVRPGDVVALVGRTGPEFIAAFFAVLAAGATPSPLAPPLTFQDPGVFRKHARQLLATARPALIGADPEFLDELRELAAGDWRVADFATIRGAHSGSEPSGGTTSAAALLQFTSGSSGPARAVQVSHAALSANVEAVRGWLGWASDTPFASWLPLHHDMGLVGGMIGPVVRQSDLWLLQPEQFVRDPASYLRCFGLLGAQITAMPPFGLDLIVRRVSPEMLRGMDFSRVHGIVIGAERIDPRTLERFHALLGPFGLQREALLPAYGLAEATLAVCGLPRGTGWTSASVRLAPGAERGTPVIGCGWPLPGISVSVQNEEAVPVADGQIGEIVVRGVSLADRVVGDTSVSLTQLAGGELRTGDAGFLLEGQLFVVGRFGDSLKVRGRVIFSEDLEASLAGIGAERQRTAVLLGVHEGSPTAVLLVEGADPAWRSAAETLLRRHAGGARVVSLNTARGAIVRTTSGKPRRRMLWRSFVEGSLVSAAEPMPARTAPVSEE